MSKASAMACLRPVVFHTKLGEEIHQWSQGGNIVVCSYNARCYCVLPKHAISGANPYDLVVTDRQKSQEGVRAFFIHSATGANFDAKESEFEDILLLSWPQDMPLDFGVEILALDEYESFQTEHGDRLEAYGAVRDHIKMDCIPAPVGYCGFKLRDRGISRFTDLRTAEGEINDAFSNIVGISGGIVWNVSRSLPAGIVLRGNIIGQTIVLHYMPFAPIIRFMGHSEVHLRNRLLLHGTPLTSGFVITDAWNFKFEP